MVSFKTVVGTLAVSSAALAVPLEARQSSGFYLIAGATTKPIHLSSINASANSFFIGRPTSSFCPDVPAIECPVGDTTVFNYGSSSVLLQTQVPGGQQVYVDPTGALKFTIPHSGRAIPAGGLQNVFGFTEQGDNIFGFLTTNALGSTGFSACPVEDNVWQVYVQAATGAGPDCIKFSALAFPTDKDAWEYL